MNPHHEAALIEDTVEQFANATLAEPVDALRIFQPHTRREFLKALPMATEAQRRHALEAYKSDQATLRAWLEWLCDGTHRKALASAVAENLAHADIGAQCVVRDDRPTVEIRPQPCGIRGLMTWAVYQLMQPDSPGTVRRCLLSAYKRTPGCDRFIFSNALNKPKLFCGDPHASKYRAQIQRGRPDTRPN